VQSRFLWIVLSATALGVLLSGCSGSSASVPVQKPSAPCDEAFDVASEKMNTLYATHPLYGDEYDALYSDGEITPEEQVRLDAMMADEDTQYSALVSPVMDACEGVEDLYWGAFAHRYEADWALLESEAVTREEAKEYFLVAYCGTYPDRKACSDYAPVE
jgi:hypothetical protein